MGPAHMGKGLINTHIFTDDFLQRRLKTIPGVHFDILFNIPRSWIGKIHYLPKEIFCIWFTFVDSNGPEALKISPNTILLFHCEVDADKCLK